MNVFDVLPPLSSTSMHRPIVAEIVKCDESPENASRCERGGNAINVESASSKLFYKLVSESPGHEMKHTYVLILPNFNSQGEYSVDSQKTCALTTTPHILQQP